MPAPYVVKPYNEGSSVGVYIVQKEIAQLYLWRMVCLKC